MSSDSEDNQHLKRRLSKRRSKDPVREDDDEVDTVPQERIEREEVTSNKRKGKFERTKALSQMKELRKTGIKRLQQYELNEKTHDDKIYDEVDESQYKLLVTNRLKERDFIVDDDGQGYGDWDEEEDYDDELVMEDPNISATAHRSNSIGSSFYSGRKRSQREKTKEKLLSQSIATDSNQKSLIGMMSMTSTSVQPTRIKPVEQDLNLDSLLEDLQNNPEVHQPNSKELLNDPSRSIPVSKADSQHRWNVRVVDLKQSVTTTSYIEDLKETIETHSNSTQLSISKNSSENLIPEDFDSFTDEPAEILHENPETKNTPTITPSATITVSSETKFSGQDWWSLCNQSSSDSPLIPQTDNLESGFPVQTDRLRVYWIDAYEQSGSIYIFGKTWSDLAKAYVSACIVVKNLQRNLFFLPQDTLRNEMTETTAIFDQLQAEIKETMDKLKISKWSSKVVSRKYSFDLPEVPTETNYLKVTYSYSDPSFPLIRDGKSFSHVFGTNTSALELFLLKRRIMGPCWLEIHRFTQNPAKVSWCKCEIVVEDSKSIFVIENEKSIPPLVCMSLSMKTLVNRQKHANEIVMISAIVHHSISAENQSKDAEKHFVHFSAVRQLGSMPYPSGFAELVSQNKMKLEVLAHVSRIDPDVIIGHNFLGYEFEILLNRMREHNVDRWSRIGRLRRTTWPKIGGYDSHFLQRSLLAGRLICDVYGSSKDLIRLKSYSLTELAANQLDIERKEIDHETISDFYCDSNNLIYLIRHCENDAYISMSLMLKLMILPLTKQLTTLAGNLWARTLMGSRAERNEFLLLHEFHSLKFVLPDKSTQKKSLKDESDDEDYEYDGEKSKSKASKRKPTYTGGLVLEPKIGFYDKYVIMLDFNSLYPSIIQEYNICFTTIQRRDKTFGSSDVIEEADLLELPEASLEMGVLPKILRTLVERRRQVKHLIAQADKDSSEIVQLDIRQKALKLTANSMYGCLGSAHSRFFARPLAMLITRMGRETLQKTVDIAQNKLNLDVIYGDTDSIMIYTKSDDLSEARRIGQLVKKEVNILYRKLEIELDGIFQQMLLLKKKKYAAIVVEEKKDGTMATSIETKGLDLVRRDWCGLSHDICSYVLNQILSGRGREFVLDSIHMYLKKAGDEIRCGLIPLDKFIINKGLAKAPEDYPDAKNQPHVQVALQLNQRMGTTFRSGDTVPYVICEGDTSLPFAQKAHHPDDLLKSELKLVVDFNWYIRQQVYPPVCRLCVPIEGTDAVKLANCLGLDVSKASTIFHQTKDDPEAYILSTQMNDLERFKHTEKLCLKCFHCKQRFIYDGVVRKSLSLSNQKDTSCGLICPNPSCSKVLPTFSVITQLICLARNFIQKYYDAYLECDESSCKHRTRRVPMGVTPYCPMAGCLGVLNTEYSDAALYDQLCYFAYLFNIDRYITTLQDDKEKELARVVTQPYRNDYEYIHQTMNTILSKSARSYINLKSIFSFCVVPP